MQPVWARSGAATNRKSADHRRNCTDLFIIVSTSPIKIACHIAVADVERAVKALHSAFELDTELAERIHG